MTQKKPLPGLNRELLENFHKSIPFLRMALEWEVIIFAGTGVIWWLRKQHTLQNFGDTLFTVACGVLCVGAFIGLSADIITGIYGQRARESRTHRSTTSWLLQTVVNT
jgi:hypothetical protein